MTATRIHPVTGKILRRGVRTETLTWRGRSTEVQVPGWYPEAGGDGIHSGADLEEEQKAWKRLKGISPKQAG